MISEIKGAKEFKTVGDLVDFLQGFDRTMPIRGAEDDALGMHWTYPLGDWFFRVGTKDEKDILELMG